MLKPQARSTIAIAVALLLASCTTTPKSCWAPPSAAEQARRAAERETYEEVQAAAKNTGDGSRVYAWNWTRTLVPSREAGGLYLLVRPDGSGTLLGAVAKPVALTAVEIAPVEANIVRAGFPDIPGIPEVVCNDGGTQYFTAGRNGKQDTVTSNQCGFFTAPLYDAVQQLRNLAEAHGGFASPDEMPVFVCPVRSL
jgi:hypothetical protein